MIPYMEKSKRDGLRRFWIKETLHNIFRVHVWVLVIETPQVPFG